MHFRIIVTALLLLLPTASLAESAQRKLFVEALGKIEAGQAEAEDFRSLSDYVLYPYLLAAELQRGLRRSPGEYTEKRVRNFLDTHGETAFTRTLRIAWIRRLAEGKQWQTLLDYYPDKASGELECLAAQAQIQLKNAGARAVAESLWLTGTFRHKACTPVFDWLEQSGGLTQALIDGRVRLAMEAGNLKLVQSLAGKQQGNYAKRTSHWLWAWRNPRDSITQLASSGDSQMDNEMLGQVFRRLATRERDRAAALYDKAMERSSADARLQQQLAAYLGFRHILNREPEALYWYRRSGTVSLRDIENDWRIRSAIYAQSWEDVVTWIDALEEKQATSPRWRYWRGRALQALGNKAGARNSFTEIAKLRDFYAFLAADQVGSEYAIVDRPVPLDSDVQTRLKARPDLRRAHELWKAGLNDKARSEWNALLESLPPQDQLQAGIIADEWGWWSRAITSYGKAGYWDDLARRFPAPFRSIFNSETKRQGIERGWALGITRSESMFEHDARSPVGALGLMQLMPATARQVARSENIRWRGTAMLYEPSHNIRLGVRYLSDMRKKFDGHIALATAAYNAGPHNVSKWRPSQTIPADIWIETVPFGATHNYLRHVLEFTSTYEWRLTGSPERLAKRLPPVKGR